MAQLLCELNIKELENMNSVSSQQSQPRGTLISLSPREAFAYLQDNAAIVDIRPEYETNYRVFDVPKVFYIPDDSYRDKFQVLPKDILLIIADCSGNRSNEVARYLIEQGYPQIACLAGGVIEWDRDGLPLSKDVDYEMIGGCACRLHPQKARIEGSSVAPKLKEKD